MKLFRDLLIILLAVFIAACANDAPKNQDLGPAPTPINPSAITPTAPTAGTATATTVQHYICPNNCANSGGPNAGSCPVCGTAYIHNAAYHNQPGMTNPATPANPLNPTANPTTPPPPPDAPNAAGVYHYTCTNGCAGGAGSAKACATCGAMLAHNQAYHSTQPGATTGSATPAPGAKSPLFINN